MVVPGGSINDLVGSLLDRGYSQVAQTVINSIGRDMTSGVIRRRLADLDAEAVRLADAGAALTADNPYLVALLDDLDTALGRAAARIDAAGGDLQDGGAQAAGTLTRQMALPGMDDKTLARIGLRWNTPDLEAVRELVGFVNSSAWADELKAYPAAMIDRVRAIAVRGVTLGWSPRKTAQLLTQTVQGLPLRQAQTMMRTLQLQSYRRATAIHQQANSDILVEQIRIGTLDTRTCMACIALHGERMPVGAVVQDHHNGRCTSVAVVKGRRVDVRTGADWFESLPEGDQLKIAGPGAYEALKTGKATLRDFVVRYDDPVYGEMVGQGTLKGLKGVR